jgi:predicted AlkP superfamily pyrophosphatase or phosphodiesterase
MNRIFIFLLLGGILLGACAPQGDSAIPIQADDLASVTPPARDDPAQPAATTTSPTTTPTSIPSPTPEPAQSVFLISWDGARADVVYELIASGVMPSFANLAENGLRASYIQSVDPSLTAPAHNSMSTGCYPSQTGIVSNAFHHPSDSFYWYRQGFTEPLQDAEPVWVTASRAGLTSAALFFPGGSPDFPWQAADYTIGYGVRDAYSQQLSIELETFEDEWQAGQLRSYSQPYSGSLTIPEVARVFVYLVDSSDDQTANHDTVLLSTSSDFSTDAASIAAGEWGALLLDRVRFSGADFLLQDINLDPEKPVLTLYHTGVHHNNATPRRLLESLNQEFGYFPAGGDQYALEHGWINEQDFLHQLEQASLWQARVSAWVYDAFQPDLLMTWQDNFDAAGHVFFLQDPQQPGYTEEKADQYAHYYQQTARTSDEALDIMLDVIDLDTTTLIMVADHGMAAVHHAVYPNTVLEKNGLLKLDSRNYVLVDQSKAFAVCSGGSTHIYINLKGYQRDGIVTEQEYPLIQSQIIDLLYSVRDPESGDPVFTRVLPKNELGSLHLDHPYSGDVFAQVKPGYALDCWRGKQQVFEPLSYYGQHGYDSSLFEMRGLFIAAGGSIPRTGEQIAPIQLVDIAPSIAAILDFTPDPRVEGDLIEALFEE